jgi:hypothetical protein
LTKIVQRIILKTCHYKMANTTYPQLEESRLPKKVRSEFLKRSLRDVWQDNIAPQSGRAASPQAYRDDAGARTRPAGTNSDRSKKHSTRRRTVPAVGWVERPISQEIDRIAQCEGISRSKTVATLLSEACRQRLHIKHAVLQRTIIEEAIARQMAKERARIASLLVRVAFDANQTRTIVTNILGRQPTMNPERMTTIIDASYKKAKKDLTERNPQIDELITAVQKWLNGEEPEKPADKSAKP